MPVHVTWRVVSGVPSLRARRSFRVIREALNAAAVRFGMTLVELSVQSNHLHLVIEASTRAQMSRGMQGLGVRLARRLNRVFGRRGKLFADRFHAHVLRTPREVLHAVRYVRANHLHHRGVREPEARARAASMFPGADGDPLSTLHPGGHGVRLRFARSWLLHDARNRLALPP